MAGTFQNGNIGGGGGSLADGHTMPPADSGIGSGSQGALGDQSGGARATGSGSGIDATKDQNREGDAKTPQPTTSWVIPRTTDGKGALAGLLMDPAYIPPLLPYLTEGDARLGVFQQSVVPLFDDYGNLWLVLADHYDPAQLAGYNRAAGAAATPYWLQMARYNLACAAWRTLDAAQYPAAVVPDGQSASVVIPDGDFMIIGNIPFTLPAIPEKGVPEVHFRCTGNRWLRLAYLTNNADTRAQWLADDQGWGALWSLIKLALTVVLDVFSFNFGGAWSALEELFDGSWVDGGLHHYVEKMTDALGTLLPELQSGEESKREGLDPTAGLNQPSAGSGSWLLYGLGAVAVIAIIVLFAQSGQKG